MGTCMSSLTPPRTRKNLSPRKKPSLGLLSRFRRSGDRKRPPGGGDLVSEEELHRVPGRAFLNGSTVRACLFTQQGRKGTNQDAMLVWENFASRDDTVLCGIFDGHGPFGHMVSKKVRDALPLKLCNQWNAVRSDKFSPHQNGITRGSSNSEETGSISIEEECPETLDTDESETPPEAYFMLRQSFLRAFKQMDKELKLHESIDCFCSGTTAVTLIKQGQDLIIGNVGDSRAVLATRGKDNSLVPVQLTVDLKPNLPGEAARIQQCKGRVFALQDEPEVARVWLPNNDSPGLAMARAFGDFCLKDYGLISVPDISYRRLTERDEFIVLATDGIWDVLSNKEVVDIVASAPTCSTAARALVDCAVRAWRLKFPTSKTDDCAAICLYLNPSPLSNHVSEINPCTTINRSMERVGGSPTNEGNTNAQELNLQLSVDSQLVNADYDLHHTCINEIEPIPEVKVDKLNERCHSTRILSDCISTAEEEEWSALEGVTRVNSLVNLPRFSGEGKSTTSET